MTDQANNYVIDAENAAEMARLNIQDRLLTEAMGGVFGPQDSLDGVTQLLDIGCGPGGWAQSVATQFPRILVTGIDISELMTNYANFQAEKQKLNNISYEVMDATGPLDFADGTFDLINGRILSGFLATSGWSSLLKECWRITRPGGNLRISEPEYGFTNSAALDELSHFAAQALQRGGHSFSPRGRTFGTTPMLRSLLLQAGYQQIRQQAHVVDYSAGAQFHESNTQNLLIVYRLLQPFLVQMGVATDLQITRLYAQLREDLQRDDFCGLDYYLTVWGQKGEAN
jgi:ubiquinone/menaquinone biosynthesis C-methylase UbiE